MSKMTGAESLFDLNFLLSRERDGGDRADRTPSGSTRMVVEEVTMERGQLESKCVHVTGGQQWSAQW